ncbi:MAG TPA: hypothetical protein VET24_07120, partial [Actinomycetota bacterium]|nr:hypothetical protein [Actinomycetota bacterium]
MNKREYGGYADKNKQRQTTRVAVPVFAADCAAREQVDKIPARKGVMGRTSPRAQGAFSVRRSLAAVGERSVAASRRSAHQP